jgi:hypothetical protein
MTAEDVDARVPAEIRWKALERARKNEKVKDLEVVRSEAGVIPSDGRSVFRFELAKAGEPNGARRQIVVDENGEPLDLAALEASELRAVFAPTLELPKAPIHCPGPGRITVDPAANDLVLKPGGRLEETIHVHVPADFGVARWDVYLLMDTTGSMYFPVETVKSQAKSLASTLLACPDVAVGVGNYRDFPLTEANPYAFEPQLSPSQNAAAVTSAIAAWTASGGLGGDYPEAQLYALYQLATDPGIHWRPGAKRLVVWIGDAPGHEPICQVYDLPNLPAAGLFLNGVISALQAANITVLALDLGGLDADPELYATDYSCPAGGSPGQASAIAAATHGIYQPGVTPATLVGTLYSLVSTAFHTIGKLSLAPSASIAPFVTAIQPATSYGPFPAGEDRTLPFAVDFRGAVACRDDEQVVNGSLDVLCNGVVVGRKPVRISVPPCLPKELYIYSVKFVCGYQREGGGRACTVRPGEYATEINIHNFQDVHACITKRVLPVVFCGSPAGREPRFVRPRAEDRIVLPPESATMDDCCRLGELLFGGESASAYPITIGFLEIESPVELCVTAVYTATPLEGGPVSIDVEQIEARKKQRRPASDPFTVDSTASGSAITSTA